MKAEDLDLHDLCNRILESDNAIRFVGMPNKMGKQLYQVIELDLFHY